MYGHKVIDELGRLSAALSHTLYGSAAKMAIIGIKNAAHFHIGSYSDLTKNYASHFSGAKLFYSPELAFEVRSPFPVFWMDAEAPFDPESPANLERNVEIVPVPRRGVLVVENAPDHIDVMVFNGYNDGSWVMSPMAYVVGIGKDLIEIPTFWNDAFVQASGVGHLPRHMVEDTIRATNILPVPLSADEPLHTSNYWKNCFDDDRQDLQALNLFMVLVNCKNVVTELVKAPEKVNRKRAKRNKHPIADYNLLKIVLPNKTKKRINGSASSLDSVRTVDFRRGHFKTYTPEAPLFGKHVGRYFWPAIHKNDKVQYEVEVE